MEGKFYKGNIIYQSDKNQIIPKELSQRIACLRFILIALVVLMHCASEVLLKCKLSLKPSIFVWIDHFILNGICNGAVPCFFIFSGFLINAKNSSYLELLKKKFFSLVVPYVLWFVIVVGIYSILYKFFPSKIDVKNYFFNWNLKTFIKKFTGIKNNFFQFPMHYQFWYIRDLIVFVVLAPVIKFLLKKEAKFSLPFLTIFFCAFAYFYNTEFCFIHVRAIFYFVLGMFFAEYKIDFFKVVDKIKYREVIIIFAIFVVLCFSEFKWNQKFSYKVYVFAATIILLKLSAIFIKSEKVFAMLKKLSGYSFFVFACHVPVLTIEIAFINWTVESQNSTVALCLSVTICLVCTLFICMGGAIVIKKILPKSYSALTGDRK